MEIFKCKHCKAKMDRDVLGSRNILLKQWGLMGNTSHHGQVVPV
jgi:transposase